jgi:MFS-type transporter involved in bile tolerance (Atg22 family)
MKQITNNWHAMRILRAVLALIILIEGISASNTLHVLFGASFLGMAIFNVGCCAGAQCNTAIVSSSDDKQNDILFEEVQSETSKEQHPA